MASSIKGTSGESLADVVRNVNDTLKAAGKFGLEVETIATALLFLKENPTMTIEYALHVGLQDWDV